MKKITIAIATLLITAACNVKQAQTTEETVTAFKTSASGQWVSKCTQILDIVDQKGNSSQITVFLRDNNTALIRVTTYAGDLNCKTSNGLNTTNVTTQDYAFDYLVSETVFKDAAKLVLTSIPEKSTDPVTVLNLKVKTFSEGKDAKAADVKLLSGSTVVIGGIATSIPDKILPKTQLRFKKAGF